MIFTHKDKSISHSYIHSLAPGVISLLNNEIDSSLLNKLTKAKYRLIINGLEIIRLLVELAEKSKFWSFLRRSSSARLTVCLPPQNSTC